MSALSYNHGLTSDRLGDFQPNPPRYVAQAFARRAQARRDRGRAAPRSPRRRRLRRAAALLGLAHDGDARRPHEHAVGQLHGRGAAQGARRALRARGQHRRGRGRRARDRRAARRPAGARRRLGPLAARPRQPARRRRPDPLRWTSPTSPRPSRRRCRSWAARGTLSDRLRRDVARGRCHAKTGTLSDVSALAGFCDTATGRRVALRDHDEPHRAPTGRASARTGWSRRSPASADRRGGAGAMAPSPG